ncbi:MAG: hypothetical protein PHE50_05820, partial [Dehalococcoidales bacterium]|nr:hypothetical protein [Dehalococcoidales bacterium]
SLIAGVDGAFTFIGLSNVTGYSYEAVVTFKEVEYSSGIVKFENGETIKSVTVNVYETTTSDAAISISLAHTVIREENNNLSVKEILVFNNTGDRAYIGSSPAGSSGHYTVLKFTLPAGATDLTTSSGLVQSYIVPVTGGFVDTLPVAPGETQVAYTYTIPVTGNSYQYSRLTDYAIGSLDILVQGDAISLTGNKFTAAGPLDMGGTAYNYYQSAGFTAGENITFNLSGLSVTTATNKSFTWIVIMISMIVVGGLLAILIIQSRKKSHTKNGETPLDD